MTFDLDVRPARAAVLVRPPLPCAVLIAARLGQTDVKVIEVGVLAVLSPKPIKAVGAAPTAGLTDEKKAPSAKVAKTLHQRQAAPTRPRAYPCEIRPSRSRRRRSASSESAIASSIARTRASQALP